jgi:hypothetical protein
VKGQIDLDAEDAQDAMEKFDSLTVKSILEKSSFENIDVAEL